MRPRDRLRYAHSGGLEHKFRYSWTPFLIAERALWVALSVNARFKSDDQSKPANFCERLALFDGCPTARAREILMLPVGQALDKAKRKPTHISILKLARKPPLDPI